jgi:predicted enzyme related to lactoylglutathione lyase
MAAPKAIGSSLTVLMVSDLARSQAFYRDVFGFDVNEWWAERDGLRGLALKLFQAADPADVKPNAPKLGTDVGVDVQVYVDTWADLEMLYKEFKEKGADIAQDIVTYEGGGPWKEFVVRDPDGYAFAFGGVDGRPGGRRSPIRSHVSSVTLWVRDLDVAVPMYADLLDIPDWFGKRYGQLHVFELENGTGLMLDANGMADIKVPEPAPVAPQFSVNTDDIEAARVYAEKLGFSIIFGIERNMYVSYFNCRDVDGNVLTVCQNHDKS